jgi:bifunctional non-homologous end joining protein LigD
VAAKKLDALESYAKKRDFSKTPEPSGAKAARAAKGEALRFVVQMHRASRLHYDFRLEADGVLKSWAIPKGPSFDTREKRLAVAVEDHPLDYRDFEGTIPEGNYGAGEVIVWDRGTYRLLEGTSLTEQIAKGSVKFEMSGKKLHGSFALVHIKGRGGEENAWLLIKERDEFVDPEWRVEDHAESVKSGKTLAEIKADRKAPQWTSSKPVDMPVKRRAAAQTLEPLPVVTSPMLATAIDEAFDDPKWLFELKWDGYRALTTIDRDGGVSIVSRNGNDFTEKFPELQTLGAAFKERPLIIDGEIVVIGSDGHASFSALQERLDRFGRSAPQKGAVTYVVFDLLYGNGRDLRAEPLVERKAALEALLTGKGPIMYSKHVVKNGKELYRLAEAQGLEGIVGKRAASAYVSRRSKDWVKLKNIVRQEVAIGGWTEARGSRMHFGALLAGVYENGEFVYVGSIGTGFDGKKLAAIAAQLAPLERKTSPFAKPPKLESKAHWVTPELVAEVSFTEWTRDGSLRHPVFVAMRVDKDPKTVVREPVRHASGVAKPDDGSSVAGGDSRAAGDDPRVTGDDSRANSDGLLRETIGPARAARAAARKAPGPPVAARSATKETITVAGRVLALSNRDKVLWPQDGYTKGDLIAYYRAVAPLALPHLTGRPLTLQRYPNGIDGPSFFEKNASKSLPDWIPTVTVDSEHGRHDTVRFMLCNDEATLVYVANLAAIVLHVWTSHAGALDTPEFVFFDLDPDAGCTLATLAKTAVALRETLASVGLAALVKSSGGSGLHVVVPLLPQYSYEICKGFAELAARTLHARHPETTTLERSPAKRPAGTVYLDYVQVGRGKTLVAPYSVRARAGAPVSMPLSWDEVEAMGRKRTKETEAQFARFNLKNAGSRLAATGDLWGPAAWTEQPLEPALEKARDVWT